MKWVLSGAMACACLMATEAHAKDYANNLESLYKQSSSVVNDVGMVTHSYIQENAADSTGIDCLTEILDIASGASSGIESVMTIADIQTSMVSPQDKKTVSRYLLIVQKQNKGALSLYRDRLNQLIGACGTRPIVVNEGQNVLSFIEQADQIVGNAP